MQEVIVPSSRLAHGRRDASHGGRVVAGLPWLLERLPPRLLVGLPQLPAVTVRRTSCERHLITRLFHMASPMATSTAQDAPGGARRIGIFGGAGIGKSVLAAWLARDVRMQALVPGGALWVDCGWPERGAHEIMSRLLADLAHLDRLTGDLEAPDDLEPWRGCTCCAASTPFTADATAPSATADALAAAAAATPSATAVDLAAAAATASVGSDDSASAASKSASVVARLTEALRARRCLIVLDNLWSSSLIEAVLSASSAGQIVLFTTRNSALALAHCAGLLDSAVHVPPLDDASARELLLRCVLRPKTSTPALEARVAALPLLSALLSECHAVPLVIAAVAHMASDFMLPGPIAVDLAPPPPLPVIETATNETPTDIAMFELVCSALGATFDVFKAEGLSGLPVLSDASGFSTGGFSTGGFTSVVSSIDATLEHLGEEIRRGCTQLSTGNGGRVRLAVLREWWGESTCMHKVASLRAWGLLRLTLHEEGVLPRSAPHTKGEWANLAWVELSPLLCARLRSAAAPEDLACWRAELAAAEGRAHPVPRSEAQSCSGSRSVDAAVTATGERELQTVHMSQCLRLHPLGGICFKRRAARKVESVASLVMALMCSLLLVIHATPRPEEYVRVIRVSGGAAGTSNGHDSSSVEPGSGQDQNKLIVGMVMAEASDGYRIRHVLSEPSLGSFERFPQFILDAYPHGYNSWLDVSDLIVPPVWHPIESTPSNDTLRGSARSIAMNELKKKMLPMLAQRGLNWEDIREEVSSVLSAPKKLKEALEYPVAFFNSLATTLATGDANAAVGRSLGHLHARQLHRRASQELATPSPLPLPSSLPLSSPASPTSPASPFSSTSPASSAFPAPLSPLPPEFELQWMPLEHFLETREALTFIMDTWRVSLKETEVHARFQIELGSRWGVYLPTVDGRGVARFHVSWNQRELIALFLAAACSAAAVESLCRLCCHLCRLHVSRRRQLPCRACVRARFGQQLLRSIALSQWFPPGVLLALVVILARLCGSALASTWLVDPKAWRANELVRSYDRSGRIAAEVFVADYVGCTAPPYVGCGWVLGGGQADVYIVAVLVWLVLLAPATLLARLSCPLRSFSPCCAQMRSGCTGDGRLAVVVAVQR